MVGVTEKRPSLIGTLAVLVLVFAMLYAGGTVDFLSGLTRPIVTAGLRLVGIPAFDNETHLTAGHLSIPWTGDCAGLNILAILVAVICWSQRGRPMDVAFWLRLAAALPLAFVANLLRIFTLIGLRWAIHPATESPQLHYFIGFLWILPFLGILLKRPERVPASFFWLEILRIAALLSLLAPFIGAPGGPLVAICTLVLMARHHWQQPSGWPAVGLYAAWLLAAALIGLSRMESLWIPWLLACPGFLEWSLRRIAAFVLILPGTVPLIAMQPVALLFIVPGIAWEIYQLWRPTADSPTPGPVSPALLTVTAFFHVFPFLAGMMAAMTATGGFPPPPGVMAIPRPGDYFLVRQIGQPADLHCHWYEPGEGGRHHTLAVCLQYRGVTVGTSGVQGVHDDGSHWLAEFFLMPDGRLLDYRGYLSATFWPFSANGVHLIYSAPKALVGADEFLGLSRKNAESLASPFRR